MDDDDMLMSGTMHAHVEFDVGFHTPVKCIDARRCNISPSISVPSSKKKRLFGGHVLGGVGMPISSSSPDVEVVDDRGFRKGFFDLGVSSYLSRYGPDVKPDISVIVASDPAYVDSPANSGASILSLANCGTPILLTVSPANCGILVKSPICRISPVISPSYDRESRLLDSKSICVALGCSDSVVAHGRCQSHIDELFDISALVLLSQEEPPLVVESQEPMVVQPSVGVAGPATVQNAGVSTPGVGDFLLMLPSDDVYVPAILDCEIDSLVNYSSDVEDSCKDSPGSCNIASGVCRFGDANGDELAAITAGGKRRSWRVEQWAHRAFDDWRLFRGYPVDKSIVDLSEAADTKPLVEMLVYFFLEVKKQDGELYNPCT
jgi:hypothetical protein